MSMIMRCDMCGNTIENPKIKNTLQIGWSGRFRTDPYEIDICDECKEKLVLKFDEGSNIHTVFKELLLEG